MSKKKQQLLNTATELFRAHGFRRITIDEICKTASIDVMMFMPNNQYEHLNQPDFVKLFQM